MTLFVSILLGLLVSAAHGADTKSTLAQAQELYSNRKPMSAIVAIFPSYIDGSLTPEGMLLLGHALYDLNFIITSREALARAGDTETVAKIDEHLDLIPAKAIVAWEKCRIRRGDRQLAPVRQKFSEERALLASQVRQDWRAAVTPGLAQLLDAEEKEWESAVSAARVQAISACSNAGKMP